MIAVVIMAGGGGTRLFPASTASKPKQFVQWPEALAGSDETPSRVLASSLLCQTYDRIRHLVDREYVFVATTAELAQAVREQLKEMPASNLIVEPLRRNSAGACALATAHVANVLGPDTVVALVPADATVEDSVTYCETLHRAAMVAEERDGIVVVAIRPTGPSTGYGYVRPGDWIGPNAFRVSAFVEKPDAFRAEKLLEEGCMWNAGIFVWRVDVARQVFADLLPLHAQLFEDGLSADRVLSIFQQLPVVSIDVGVAERARSVYCVVGHFSWDDLGTWDAFARVFPPDASGNVALGDARFIDSHDCVAVLDAGRIVTLGVSDLVIVRFGDTVFVCPRSRSQDVGKVERMLDGG